MSLANFWRAANTYNSDEFDSNIQELKSRNLGMFDRLNEIGFKTWANSKFPAERSEK